MEAKTMDEQTREDLENAEATIESAIDELGNIQYLNIPDASKVHLMGVTNFLHDALWPIKRELGHLKPKVG